MKKYEVLPLDTKYSPPSVHPPGQIFDSIEEANDFARAAAERDTEKRYVFTVDEIEAPEK
jgi:hypothetical protein